ncbi:flagellar hook protein FlgE [Massilia sp. Leaf139]|uniref:flagellar hook protein FlgE n=1 Tax=Massilia sp. Leaf139 TaxID=1736272 RepID=UPI0006F48F8F|nr:flagellar hook-basal body complex protein [Massilia sp. Leaf139]KQQ91606.1 flagellar biosynthesis protein FlgE [Massilia sp. Leaf139]
MSFNIALSGIQAINEQLEAVSNNIANSSTYGFKSSRANFSAMYAGEQANGVSVGSLTQNIGTNGSVESTGRSLDAAIEGRGFFVTRDSQGTMSYSRVGIFAADNAGNLVDAAGRKVQGYGPTVNGTLGTMGDIQIPTGQIAAKASTGVNFVGNLSADWQKPTNTTFDATKPDSYNMVKQSVLYDSLGTQHTVSQYFVKTGSNSVTVHYGFDGAAPTATKALTFDALGQLPAATTSGALTLTPTNGAAPINFSVDYTGTTQFAGEATSTTNSTDGYASGTYVGVELAADGSVVARYSNEQKQTVGTIALATFGNEGALTATSDTSWQANAASGLALFGTPGAGLAGKLNTGALEGSNVDITSELVGLMTSQRNYQANSKVITTENQMMQALMQAL